MKNQIVLWGKDEKEQDILVTLRLRVEDRKVDLWTFKKSDLKEDFVEKMFEDWKGIDPKEFPEPFTHVEREVSNSELLPENIKTTQTDLIIRAEKEWYFQVLAYQVFEQLKTELTAFSEQVKSLGTHSQDFWDEAVAFSNKIKDHAMARTLMRPQITELRKVLDNSFDHLKKLMSADRKDFDKEANENYDAVIAKLTEYRTRIENNENFKDIFDQLKGYQTDLKEVKLKMGQRKDIWGKMNEVFNLVKSKRGTQNSGRLEGRIAGLKKAIDRMDRSVFRDTKDLDFHKKQVEKAGSRMEVQLREAKMQLLETTLNSKQEKLDDMLATLKDLETKLANSQEQQAKEAATAEEKVTEKPVNEIAASAEEKASDLLEDNTEKAKTTVTETAEVIKTSAAEKTDAILEKADQTTAKVEAAVDEKTAKIEEMIAKGEDEIAENIEGNDAVKAPAIESVEDQLDKIDMKIDEVVASEDDLKDVKSQAEEKLEAVTDKAEELLDSAKDTIEEKTGIDLDDLAEKGSEKLSQAKNKASEVAENLKDTIEDKTGVSFESLEEKGEELLDDVTDKVSGFFSALKSKAEEAFDSTHDYVAKKAEDAEKEATEGDEEKKDV